MLPVGTCCLCHSPHVVEAIYTHSYVCTQLCIQLLQLCCSSVAALLQCPHVVEAVCVCEHIYIVLYIVCGAYFGDSLLLTHTASFSRTNTHARTHTQLVSISGTASYGSVAAYSRRFTLAQVCICSVACSVECSVATYSRLVTLAQM